MNNSIHCRGQAPAISGAPVWKLAAVLLLAGCWGTGCKSYIADHDMVVGPSYKPSNVYRASAVMPQNVRRVAVLPLTSTLLDAASAEGREALEPVLSAELSKTKAFEVIPLTAAQMVTLAGKARWSAEEMLPTNLVKNIRETVGCDALLFAKLTQFRAYPPIAIGWNLKLVECQENRILWSVDEVFDSGDGAVVNAARRYYHEYLNQPEPLGDSQSILSSPRRFGQYTLQAVLATLPAR